MPTSTPMDAAERVADIAELFRARRRVDPVATLLAECDRLDARFGRGCSITTDEVRALIGVVR